MKATPIPIKKYSPKRVPTSVYMRSEYYTYGDPKHIVDTGVRKVRTTASIMADKYDLKHLPKAKFDFESYKHIGIPVPNPSLLSRIKRRFGK